MGSLYRSQHELVFVFMIYQLTILVQPAPSPHTEPVHARSRLPLTPGAPKGDYRIRGPQVGAGESSPSLK
jgi:hypothetical protein